MRSCLKKYLPGQGYADLFCLALLGNIQSLEIDKPADLPNYQSGRIDFRIILSLRSQLH
jgi:hypothetical protein